MKDIMAALGIGSLGIVAIILIMVFFFAVGTAITGLIIAFAWNWCGLYTVFNASPLSFWEVAGIAAAFNLIRGIFTRSYSVERS